MEEQKTEEKSCCPGKNEKSKGFWSGLIYGLVPHTGCIAFIIFAILGITTATALIKPLLMNRYFFYMLIALSFIFATISAAIYLKKFNLLSFEGIKKKKGYLSILYGTSMGINILLFLVIFPMVANITTASESSAAGLSQITLKVDIPCPGHAPLISGELKQINGVDSVKFSFPNNFEVSYDSSKTSENEITALAVFKEYPATKTDSSETASKSLSTSSDNAQKGGCGGCGSGTCSLK